LHTRPQRTATEDSTVRCGAFHSQHLALDGRSAACARTIGVVRATTSGAHGDLDNQIHQGGVPMKSTVMRVVALVLAVAMGPAFAQDSRTPNVSVQNRVISVSEDPINLDRSNVNSQGRWQITWVLTDSKAYRFSPRIGIDIKGDKPDDLRCNRQANGARYVCSFKPKSGKFSYKYDVNIDPQPSGQRITLDPRIITNF
jgi:hypothetical protein